MSLTVQKNVTEPTYAIAPRPNGQLSPLFNASDPNLSPQHHRTYPFPRKQAHLHFLIPHKNFPLNRPLALPTFVYKQQPRKNPRSLLILASSRSGKGASCLCPFARSQRHDGRLSETHERAHSSARRPCDRQMLHC